MTSGGGTFSPEEIKYLKSLPAVAEATAKRITYTDDFKRYCVVHYNEGASPVRMFREAGLDPALIGYKRIERCIARWRENPDELSAVDSRTARLERIEEEIKYLEQQAKKIRLAEDKEASKQ
jgi:hypothetical protein